MNTPIKTTGNALIAEFAHLVFGAFLAVVGIWSSAVATSSILSLLGFLMIIPAGLFISMGSCRLVATALRSVKPRTASAMDVRPQIEATPVLVG